MSGVEDHGRKPVNVMLAKLGHMSFSMMFLKAKDLGIHPGQVPICAYLYHHDGCRQKEIVEALRIKPSTVSVSMERLEKNGLITRRPEEGHPRIVRVYVTEKLRECYRTLKNVLEESDGILLNGFSEKEKEQMCEYLQRMIGNLEQVQKSENGSRCCGQEEL